MAALAFDRTMECPAPGIVLCSKYRLVHELGAGGMGTVWLARNEALGKDVAVKLLLTGIDATDAAVTGCCAAAICSIVTTISRGETLNPASARTSAMNVAAGLTTPAFISTPSHAAPGRRAASHIARPSIGSAMSSITKATIA